MPPIPKQQKAKEERQRAVQSLPAPLRNALTLLDLGWPITEDEAKGAYRKAALKSHPDRGGSDQAMKDLNSAFELVGKAIREGPRDRWGGTCESEGQPRRRHSDYDHTNQYQWWGYSQQDREYEQRQQRRYRGAQQAEPCEYVPAANATEAMERISDLSRASFVNLQWWPPSRNNPDNITRLWLGVRFTIFYREGRYGWCMGMEGSPTFGPTTYRSRRECVTALADVLLL